MWKGCEIVPKSFEFWRKNRYPQSHQASRWLPKHSSWSHLPEAYTPQATSRQQSRQRRQSPHARNSVKRWWFWGSHQPRTRWDDGGFEDHQPRTRWDDGGFKGTSCVCPKGPSSQLRATVVSEEVDGGSERVLLLSEELAIEHHDTALECTGRLSPPIPYGTSSTTELCGRSRHHSRLVFAPTIARS